MIRIFPRYHFNKPQFRESFQKEEQAPLLGAGRFNFFSNGKAGIHSVIQALDLKKEDIVSIFTSTESTFVSTCVSATIFNYCGISRIITPNTKLIYVIHEFGKVHPRLKELYDLSRALEIPLLEDCAHTMDPFLSNNEIGQFGDFILFSLPKIFPMEAGGLIIERDSRTILKKIDDPRHIKQIASDFEHFLPYLSSLSDARKENYSALAHIFNSYPTPLTFENTETPYFYILITDKYKDWYKDLSNKYCEWGITHVKNWFCIPTQPLVRKEEFVNLGKSILNEIH